MRSIRTCTCILLVALLALMLAASLGACHKDVSPLSVHLEGEAYRGAAMTLYAGLSAKYESQGTQFAIVEGGDYAYIHNGQLKILNTAPVGGVVRIEVSDGDYREEVSCTIGHTPVQSVALTETPAMDAGDSLVLHAHVSPAYADDNAVTYQVIEGAASATIDGDTLTILPSADRADTIRVTATAGGVTSAPITVRIRTVQAIDIALQATTALHQNEKTAIQTTLLPADATVGVIYRKVPSDYSDVYVNLTQNVVQVAADAPAGTFSIEVVAGTVHKILPFEVLKTPVDMVGFSRTDGEGIVCYGDVITTSCRVYPDGASDPYVTYSVSDGAEFVDDLGGGSYRITTHEVGVSIVLRATADGKYNEIRLVTGARDLFVTSDGTPNVTVGETRRLSYSTEPAGALGSVTYEIVEGQHLCVLDGNILTFVAIGNGNDSVVVRATLSSTTSTITFHVVPVKVESIVIRTEDNTVDLREGDVVTFSGTVSPATASHPGLTYYIVEGESLATITDHQLRVGYQAIAGTISVEARSEDGITSNRIRLTTLPGATAPTLSDWSALDNRPDLLHQMSNACLDLRDLPYAANDTVVIVSDDVDVLTILGNYQGTPATCYTNLYFYFLTTDAITVILQNVGIVIDGGYTDTVLDFGGEAVVTLQSEGTNYVAAGHAYRPYTNGFMIEGDYSTSRMMDGMDGFAGRDGGHAICAYDLTLTGAGTLTLVGGNASSGTDGTDGLSTQLADTYAGNGGLGGDGGTGGYAVYADHVTYDFKGTVTLYAGNSGMAGMGGAGGTGYTSTYNGLAGANGTAGKAHDPVYTRTRTYLQGNPTQHMGAVVHNATTRPLSGVAQAADALSRHYKVNIYYNSGWQRGYASKYTMTQLNVQTDTAELMRMMHGLDYALSALGRNVMIDVGRRSGTVTYYLCKSIRQGSDVIYGLTDDANKVWLSAFETRKRDCTMYSTYYNIMVHEMLHLLYFCADNAAQAQLSASSLSAYNNGWGYYKNNSSNNNSNGVYSSLTGNGATCSFLTVYSKLNNMEDISETLSYLCIQAQAHPYDEGTSRVAQKAVYVSRVFAAEYDALAPWKPMAWLRYIKETLE